jgi:hypothetical protein
MSSSELQKGVKPQPLRRPMPRKTQMTLVATVKAWLIADSAAYRMASGRDVSTDDACPDGHPSNARQTNGSPSFAHLSD